MHEKGKGKRRKIWALILSGFVKDGALSTSLLSLYHLMLLVCHATLCAGICLFVLWMSTWHCLCQHRGKISWAETRAV